MITLFLLLPSTFAQEEGSTDSSDDLIDLNNIIGKPDDRFEEIATNFQNINLFSGDMSENIPLISLKGRNGMDFSLNLGYSSNYDASIENKEQPTSWLGLGWGIGFGSITADTKGTASFKDDTFYLNNEKMILIPNTNPNNKYKLKNFRYITIERYDDGNTISQWKVINEDGSETIYGSSDNAKNFMISSGNWIGNVFSGNTELTPYAWQLYKQKDLFGNEITYEYEKTEEYLKSGDWQSTNQYTKAIYISNITDSIGRKIIFNTEDKVADEYYDQYSFCSAPDSCSYMRFYEDKYLDNIEVLNTDGTQFQKVVFDYDVIGRDQLTKRLLKSVEISIYNDGWNKLPKTEFEYFDENYLLGKKSYALEKIMHPTGGLTEYTYQEQALEYTQLDGEITQDETHVSYLGNNYMVVKHGSKIIPQPNTFQSGSTLSRSISVYNWDGHKYTDRQDFDNIALDNMHIYTGPDYFLARPLRSGLLIMYKRTGDTWEEETEITFEHGGEIVPFGTGLFQSRIQEKEVNIYPLENNIFILSGDRRHKLKIVHKFITDQNIVEWREVSIESADGHPGPDGFPGKARIWPSDKFFVVRYDLQADRMNVYNWNEVSKTWEKKIEWEQVSTASDALIENDYFIVKSKFGILEVYEYDGDSWEVTKAVSSLTGTQTNNRQFTKVASAPDFFIFGNGNQREVFMYKRLNNHRWSDRDKFYGAPDPDQRIDGLYANDKYIGIVTRKEDVERSLKVIRYYYTIFNKINDEWVKTKDNVYIGYARRSHYLVNNGIYRSDGSYRALDFQGRSGVSISFGKDLFTVELLDQALSEIGSTETPCSVQTSSECNAWTQCNKEYSDCLGLIGSRGCFQYEYYPIQDPFPSCSSECRFSWNYQYHSCFSENDFVKIPCERSVFCVDSCERSYTCFNDPNCQNNLNNCKQNCESDCAFRDCPDAKIKYDDFHAEEERKLKVRFDDCRGDCTNRFEQRNGFNCATGCPGFCGFTSCRGLNTGKCPEENFERIVIDHQYDISGTTEAFVFNKKINNWQELGNENIGLQFRIEEREQRFFPSESLAYDFGFSNPDLYHDTIALSKSGIFGFPETSKYYKSVRNQAKGPAKVYPIKTKTVDDRLGHRMVYSFDFNNGKYDPTLQTVQFNKATIYSPDNSGKIVNYFYNGLSKEDALNDVDRAEFPDKIVTLFKDGSASESTNTRFFRKLTGILYKSETFAQDVTLVANSLSEYEIVDKKHGSFIVRNKKSINDVEGVVVVSEINQYNEENGMPKTTTTYDNKYPDKKLITKTIFAFENYPDMKTSNMLIQPYEARTYENTELKSAQKIEYRKVDNIFAPWKTHAWKDNNYMKISEIVNRDNYGNVLKTSDAKNNVQYIRYDDIVNAHPVEGWNNVIGDESNPAWRMSYNNKWQPFETFDANNQKTSITYDKFNRPKTITMPKDQGSTPTTEYEYESYIESDEGENRVITKQKTSDKPIISYNSFDGLGRTYQLSTTKYEAAVIGSNKNVIVINTFNDRGLQEKSYKPKIKTGLTFVFKISDASDTMSTNQQNGFIEDLDFIKTEYYKDPLARVSKVISYDPNYATEKFYGGSNGQRIEKTKDANNHYTKSTFDAFGNLVRFEENSNDGITFQYTTTYTYDILGRLLTIIDPRNHVTTNIYNTLSQLEEATEPDRGTTRFEYDNNGNLIKRTDEKGTIVTYEYDGLNRLTKVDYPSTIDTIRTYDNCQNGKGRLCHVEDSSGEMDFFYDENGNVVKEIKKIVNQDIGISKEFVIKYDYDSAGNLIEQILPDTTVIKYNYNRLNQLESLEKDNVEIAKYEYNNPGTVKKQEFLFDNNLLATTDYTYDKNLWLESIDAKNDNILFQRSFNYDLIGNIVDKFSDITKSNKLAHYIYDPLDRLKDVTESINYYGEEIHFTYDSTGNRLTRNSVSYNYKQTNNQLESDSNFNYVYDANGNMISKSNGQTTTYEYDEENRLIQVNLPNGNVNEYVYDMNGLRAIKKDSTGITIYVYDMAGNVIYEETQQVCSLPDYGHGCSSDIGPGEIVEPYLCSESSTCVSCDSGYRWVGLFGNKNEFSDDCQLYCSPFKTPTGENESTACSYEDGWIRSWNRNPGTTWNSNGYISEHRTSGDKYTKGRFGMEYECWCTKCASGYHAEGVTCVQD